MSGPILPINVNNTIRKNLTKKVTVLVHLSIHRNWKCERTPGLVSAESDFPGEPVYADCHLVVTEVQVQNRGYMFGQWLSVHTTGQH